jgi:hypothetical protein
MAQTPTALPHYDVSVHLDVAGHTARVCQRVVWINPGPQPAPELVFNAHAHFKLPDKDVGMTAKMFEILRINPGEALDTDGRALEVQTIRLLALGASSDARPGPAPQELSFFYQKNNDSALVAPLPRPVLPGETVQFEMVFVFRLPQLQGRWGQWRGVTTLSNWLPVLAYYAAAGWHPTPYIPWHQPFFNEAGLYSVRLVLPCDQKVACTAPVLAEQELADGLRQVDFAPCQARDFAILCSAKFHEFTAHSGAIHVRCLAFPEHEKYARFMLQCACDALATYTSWFGPYPYSQFTIVESFFGWNSNECAGLIMMDERLFHMAYSARGFVDYLVAHATCHQWWYNVVGTNGYCETWMDEGLATYFAYRLMRQKYGRNDMLVHYPRCLQWMPNVHREDYRHFYLYGTLGRGEATPTIQEIPKFQHLVTVYSMCYERGGKIVGMIEERLGEPAFFDFLRWVYAKYSFRVLRVADFQRELETFTGRSWEEFFYNWLYGVGMTDWCLEDVDLQKVDDKTGPPLYKVTVTVRQCAEYNEPTVLGFRLEPGDGYQVRVPIVPQAAVMELPNIPARMETRPGNRVRVEVVLPCKPLQIAVDPDQVLVDRNPANNFWKQSIKPRFTLLYTFLDENDLTNAYDHWNLIAGPWLFAPTYDNPFFTRSTRIGGRAGVYRTAQFEGGVYTAYRTDYRDVVTGADMVLEHWPWDHAEIGFVAERRLAGTLRGETNANRGVLYCRHVIDYGDSLYLPPFHYIETFGTIQDDLLPLARQTVPGGERFKHQAMAGLHYHINYLTPYWDAEGGFSLDASYAMGVEIPGEGEGIGGAQQLTGQFVYVDYLPDGLGWFSDTRLAFRLAGAIGGPSRVQYFALGGGELFRGFDLAQRQGSKFWVTSLEWRVPLLRHLSWGLCDHALEVRNVYAALFTDVGEIYLNGASVGGVAETVGVGLRIDVAWFTFVERTILRFDTARAIGAGTPEQYWFGIEHPF